MYWMGLVCIGWAQYNISTQSNMKVCFILLLCLTLSQSFSLQKRQQPPPAYSVDLSQQIVRWAAVAFCKNGCVDKWSCVTGLSVPLVETFYVEHSLTKAAGFVGYSVKHNSIVLSFRGSNNVQNWIQDFAFEKVDYPRCSGCQVHAGFLLDYLLLENIITKKISALLQRYPNAQIITTGHSLGAALSAIAAIELKSIFNNTKVIVHNFGQPRVGNKKLAQFESAKLDGIYRVVHYKDLVPHLAPHLEPFEYHHSAHEIFFNADFSSFKVCDMSGEDKSCSNQYFPEYNPNDHDHYFINISETQC